MKREQFEKAQININNIDNITKLKDRFKFGEIKPHEEVEFQEANDDFYQARFFNIKNYTISKSTGGGSIDLDRIKITEHNDSSGASYSLTKKETIDLQSFIMKMLSTRLVIEKNKLDAI